MTHGRHLLLVLILASLCVARAWAGSGGSTYSIVGIGDIRYYQSIRSAGMGFTGLSLHSPLFINAVTPAAWSRIDRAMLEAGVLYEGFNSTDGTNSRYLGTTDFNGGMLAFPISEEDGIVFGGGFMPYSNVDYDTYTNGSYVSPRDSFLYSLNHVGLGGLGTGRVGLSYAPLNGLALGVTFDYVFGSIERKLDQKPASDAYLGGNVEERNKTNGVTWTFGLIYDGFEDLASVLGPLSVGGFVTTRGYLTTTQQTFYQYTIGRDTSAELEGTFTLPLRYGFGIGYQIGSHFLLAADYEAQPWSTARLNGQPVANVRDSYRAGFGAEILASRVPTASWFLRTAYRLGFSYSETYYEVHGQPINEWSVTGGIDFPFSGLTRLGIALEYGGRGTTEAGLIKDKFIRFYLSINIGEEWFVRPEEED
ncbi:MAG: hypothetical protein WBH56_03900 [Bacteroidota bacterium]